MKKNIFILGALVVAALFTACQNDDEVVAPAAKLTEVTLTAEFPEITNENGTRAQLGADGLSVEWNADDVIFTNQQGSPGNPRWEFTATTGGSVTEFRGAVDFSVLNNDKTYREIFVYPNTAGCSTSFNRATNLTIPNEQVLTPNSFDPKANVAVAIYDLNQLAPVESEGETSVAVDAIHFRNVCGLLGMAFKGDGVEDLVIESIEIIGKGGLTGLATIQAENSIHGKECYLTDSPIAPQNAVYSMVGMTTKDSRVILKDEAGINLKDYPDGVKFYACVVPRWAGDGNSKKWEINYIQDIYHGCGAESGDYEIIITLNDGSYVAKTITLNKVGDEEQNGIIMAGQLRILGSWNLKKSMFKKPLSMTEFNVNLTATALPAFKNLDESNLFERTWTSGDQIATRLNENSTNYTLTYDSATTAFTGIWNMNLFNEGSYKDATEIFVYPTDLLVGKGEIVENNGYTTRLVRQPNEQNLVKNSYDSAAAIAAARYELDEYDVKHAFSKTIDFYNYSGLLGVKLTGNATVTSIEITASTGFLAGTYYLQLLSDGFKIYSRAKQADNPYEEFSSVVLSKDGGVELDGAGNTFYACVIPRGKTNALGHVHQDGTGKPFAHGAVAGKYSVTVKTTANPTGYTVSDIEVSDMGSSAAITAGHARVIATINAETGALVTE